ncbi:MAG TPA: nucleoside monophosphate kinase [Candidatus Paceibacterota bacterium]
MSVFQPITVAFFGVSGAGKGTQAELLDTYLCEHDRSRGVIRPEMGTLVRTFMREGTVLAKHTERIQAEGGLLPSFIPIYLLARYMNEKFTGTEHIILDGVCRRPAQSQAVDEMMRLWGRENVRAIVFDISEESAKRRLLARGRHDDSDEIIRNRFAWYEKHVVPSYKELERLGWTILRVDGEPDVATIHKNILKMLNLT